MQRPMISLFTILKRHRAWLAIFPLPFVLLTGLAAFEFSERERLLLLRGETAEVRVDGLDTRRRSASGRSMGRETVHQVHYAFERSDGEIALGPSAVSRGFHNDLAVGDRIPVRYVPDRPDIHVEVEPGEARVEVFIFGTMAVVGVLGMLGLGTFFWRRCVPMHRAIARGDRRRARITGYRAARLLDNKDYKPLQRLEWIVSAGQAGLGLPNPAHSLRDVPEGSEITVYIDPASGRGFWERDILRA